MDTDVLEGTLEPMSRPPGEALTEPARLREDSGPWTRDLLVRSTEGGGVPGGRRPLPAGEKGAGNMSEDAAEGGVGAVSEDV